jgi:DNA-binding response OmpR family regulator
LLLTADPHPGAVLPALGLLPHAVHPVAPHAAALLNADRRDAVLVDARTDVVAARSLCRLLSSAGTDVPVIAVLTEDGLVTMSGEWAVDEILLTGAGPAEVDARLRRLYARSAVGCSALVLGELMIDEAAYVVRLRRRLLELTYVEFALLNYLAQHAGQTFSRGQLLRQVWGDDFVGGVRTVDVHVRRLRAKLGSGHEQMLATVHGVGYTLVPPAATGGGRLPRRGRSTTRTTRRSTGRRTSLSARPESPVPLPSRSLRPRPDRAESAAQRRYRIP